MNILTVIKVQFKIGAVLVDGYTANEIDPVTGHFINYLSGAGLAASIGLDESTTRSKRLPKGLQTILGEGFTARSGFHKLESGGKAKINLWSTTAAAQYYRYHDKQGNVLAGDIVTALVATTLDIIIDDACDRIYKKGAAEAKNNARLAGIVARKKETDAIKTYLETHEVSDGYRQFVYSNCSDKINLALFGKKAKKLKEERGCKDNDALRDSHCKEDLAMIERIEAHAARLILKGMEPQLATSDAIEFYTM